MSLTLVYNEKYLELEWIHTKYFYIDKEIENNFIYNFSSIPQGNPYGYTLGSIEICLKFLRSI